MPAKKAPAKKTTPNRRILAAEPPKRSIATEPPPEARAYPPKESWLASDENRAELERILHNKVFLAAAHYITEQNRLAVAHLVTESMPDNVIARRASVHAGCVEFISGLRNLVAAKTIPYTPEPYGYIKSIHDQ